MKKYITLLFIAISHFVYAEGSKDLYPVNSKGTRAFLSAGSVTIEESNYLQGVHFVWVKSGETIAVASSAQNVLNGRILLKSPSGVNYSTGNNEIGKIKAGNGFTSREAELAGPRIGYDAYEVPVNESGIWEIKFVPPLMDVIAESPGYQSNENWRQDSYLSHIAAWDVSVRNEADTHWINGRVFTHSLLMYINSRTMHNANGGFYGKNYILTNDGVLYRTDANGNHGVGFSFYANNTGFVKEDGLPIYKSIKNFKKDGHYPYMADTKRHVTHKIFYNLPDSGLPTEAKGIFPGGKTWLLNRRSETKITNIKLTGFEGIANTIGMKGGWIEFEASVEGRYSIALKPKFITNNFSVREIITEAVVGTNKVYWDGLDGDGKFMPNGDIYPIEIDIALVAGEVHFPYLDMELNENGLLLEEFNLDGVNLGYVNAYWDDSDISTSVTPYSSNPLVNLTGIISSVNGHKWGGVQGNYFGDTHGMDTWTYIKEYRKTFTLNLTVKIYDLEVKSITSNKSEVLLGEELDYTVVIRNNGPQDADDVSFLFDMPNGVELKSFQLKGSCGQIKNNDLRNNQYKAKLYVPTGCEMIFVFRSKVVLDNESFYSEIPVVAKLVRGPDATDPNATDVDLKRSSPGTAEEECQVACNNILQHNDLILIDPIEEGAKIGLIKSVEFKDVNMDDQVSADDELIYSFRIKNLGNTYLTDLLLVDNMLSSDPIWKAVTLLENSETIIQSIYKLKSTDIGKEIENTAIVYAKTKRNRQIIDVSGDTFEDDNPTVFSMKELPKIYLKKIVQNIGTGENGQFTLNDIIVYRFEVKHSGSSSVMKVKLDDRLLNTTIQFGDLQNSETKLSVSNLLINEKHISDGQIINSASVKGFDSKYQTPVNDISGLTFDDDLPTVTVLARPYKTVQDQFEVYQGEKVKIDVLKNDMPGSSSLRRIVFDKPLYGSLIYENESYYYQPNIGYKDVKDVINYYVEDASLLKSKTTTLTITIKPTSPVAVDDLIKVNYNSSINIDVLSNDYAQKSQIDASTLTIFRYPKNGNLKILASGILVYQPFDNFTGNDEFEYYVMDANKNWSNVASVIIEVSGLFIPNVITPNDDGVNDSFNIIGTNIFDKVELQVLNRQGAELYRTNDYHNDWIPDKSVPDGTYFYLLKLYREGEKTIIRKGNLLIMRALGREWQ